MYGSKDTLCGSQKSDLQTGPKGPRNMLLVKVSSLFGF